MSLTRRRQRARISIREQDHIHLVPPRLLRGVRRHPFLHTQHLLLTRQHRALRECIRDRVARHRCALVGQQLRSALAAFQTAAARVFPDGVAPVQMLPVCTYQTISMMVLLLGGVGWEMRAF